MLQGWKHCEVEESSHFEASRSLKIQLSFLSLKCICADCDFMKECNAVCLYLWVLVYVRRNFHVCSVCIHGCECAVETVCGWEWLCVCLSIWMCASIYLSVNVPACVCKWAWVFVCVQWVVALTTDLKTRSECRMNLN